MSIEIVAPMPGTIINILSFLVDRPAKGAANYAASKAGLLSLTKTAALELGRYGIRVNGIIPGFHVTDMNKDFWEKFEVDIRREHLIPELPDRKRLAEFVFYVTGLKTVTGQVFSFESRI